MKNIAGLVLIFIIGGCKVNSDMVNRAMPQGRYRVAEIIHDLGVCRVSDTYPPQAHYDVRFIVESIRHRKIKGFISVTSDTTCRYKSALRDTPVYCTSVMTKFIYYPKRDRWLTRRQGPYFYYGAYIHE